MHKIKKIINNRYISYSFAIIILALLLIAVILLSYLFYQSKNMKISFNDDYIRIDTKQIKAYQKEEASILTAVVEEKENKTEKQENVEDLVNKETSIATNKIKQNATQEVVNIVKEEKEEKEEKKGNEEEEKIEKVRQKKSKAESLNNNIVVQKKYRGYQATRIY